ncbi:MAG: fimbrillin family protein [Bacteroidaceae bacterium]|nr:fimbrillin family protein [Bacteroidaceae bacterium]
MRRSDTIVGKVIRLIGLIGLMGLMGACSFEQEPAPEVQSVPIGFSTYTAQTVTRATEIVNYIPQGLSIGVFSYYHNGTESTPGAYNEATSIPDFMFNQQCTSTEDGRYFAYSPLKYWPNYEHDRLSFIAYYPYTNSELEATTGVKLISTNTTPGLPKFEFVNKDVDQQPDFIISELVRDVSKESASVGGESGAIRVRFELKHALAKVEFRISIHPDIRQHFAQLRLNKLSITNIKDKGDLKITEAPESSGNILTWTALSDAGTPGELSKRDYDIVDNEHNLNDLKKVYLLMPQELDDDAELTLDYELTLKGYNSVYTYDANGKPVLQDIYTYKNDDAHVKLNEMKYTSHSQYMTEWEANHHYILNVQINANSIEYTGQVVDWGDQVQWDGINVDEIVM